MRANSQARKQLPLQNELDSSAREEPASRSSLKLVMLLPEYEVCFYIRLLLVSLLASNPAVSSEFKDVGDSAFNIAFDTQQLLTGNKFAASMSFKTTKRTMGGSSVVDPKAHTTHKNLTSHPSTTHNLPHKSIGINMNHNEERTAQIINERVRMDTLKRFTSLCRQLNLEPLCSNTLHILTLMFSRSLCTISPEAAQECIRLFAPDVVQQINWEIYPELIRNSNFNTIHDWVSLFHYFEINTDIDLVALHNNALIKRIIAALNHTGMDKLLTTKTDFIISIALHICNYLTPQDKMLERAFISHAKKEGFQAPQDIELKCLKILSHFNDSQNNTDQALQDLQDILSTVSLSSRFIEDVSAFFSKEEAENKLYLASEKKEKDKGRVRLRYFAQSVDNQVAQSYERTFASWANAQRFPISTSLRLQNVLYFLRVQVDEIPMSTYTLYFSEGISARVMQSSVDSIDIEVVGQLITGIRTYHFKIPYMLDFRSQCLHGLSVSTRKSLTPAQVLQLYICCYQHYSVREHLWRRVVNVWNHSIATALKTFGAQHEFDADNVLHAIMYDPQKNS